MVKADVKHSTLRPKSDALLVGSLLLTIRLRLQTTMPTSTCFPPRLLRMSGKRTESSLCNTTPIAMLAEKRSVYQSSRQYRPRLKY
jgi:hypothetical protein